MNGNRFHRLIGAGLLATLAATVATTLAAGRTAAPPPPSPGYIWSPPP